MRADFPEPDTPHTPVKAPIGNRAVTPFRLCSRAPRTSIADADPAPRFERLGGPPYSTGPSAAISGGSVAADRAGHAEIGP